MGFLQVTNTQPADGNQEVDADTTIAVVFNRPVVPLTGVEQQKDLPQPLTFDPPVAGKGTWLNTSIYQFQPDQPLAGGADYKATVPAGLEDTSGGLLAEDFVFTFRTASPLVTSFQPEGEQVAPTTAMTVTFSQAMDRESTEAAFSLKADQATEPVAGNFRWLGNDRVMVFKPTALLDYATAYEVEVTTTARSATGAGTLREGFGARFATVPKIGLVGTDPADGQSDVRVEREFVVKLRGIVNERTLGADAFTIVPEPTAVYSYYNSYENRYVISWPMQPQTGYTVTLAGKIADIFGNTLGQDEVIRFRTGDRKPFAHLNVPNEVGTYNAYADTEIAVSYRNVSELNFKLYTVSEADCATTTGSRKVGKCAASTNPRPMHCCASGLSR